MPGPILTANVSFSIRPRLITPPPAPGPPQPARRSSIRDRHPRACPRSASASAGIYGNACTMPGCQTGAPLRLTYVDGPRSRTRCSER
jgi:hypothetical protein